MLAIQKLEVESGQFDTDKLVRWLVDNDHRFHGSRAALRARERILLALDEAEAADHFKIEPADHAVLAQSAAAPQIAQATRGGVRFLGYYPWRPAWQLEAIIDAIVDAKPFLEAVPQAPAPPCAHERINQVLTNPPITQCADCGQILSVSEPATGHLQPLIAAE